MLSAAPNGAAQTLSSDSRRLDQLKQDVQTELRRADEQPTVTSARLRTQLDDLQDEVGYLRVVQRRGQTIKDTEYRQLESRLQSIRQELRATTNVRPGLEREHATASEWEHAANMRFRSEQRWTSGYSKS